MKDFFSFLLLITDELYELFIYYKQSGRSDPEKEKQLAMEIVRKVSDERTRKEIEGA